MENTFIQRHRGVTVQHAKNWSQCALCKYTPHFKNGVVLAYLQLMNFFIIFGHNTTIGSVLLSNKICFC